ncbi:MAG: type I restriction enzyme HsdR N-terminal domain-containing protein, partial [Gammaproteobacteria bacterium]|nr:type I restriction enzyme HsdR N-terminal domain-containing protein [Gammaproteobacteria bacterium]
MALEDTIADIVRKLREGAFPNEQSVSQGIVLRVLSDLHWDVFEPSVVWPEYATADGGRADFALCEPRSKPKVLIEVKQPGKAEDGVRQSLQYAFHTGVPFVVLTDGQTWRFYLPAEPGDYEDRQVFKLDLYEHSAQRSAAVLEGYLHWQGVASGKALDSARNEHRSQARRAVARRAIPDAWRKLVEQRDELLIDLVGEAVESKEGVRPDNEDVARFLAGLETSGTIGRLPSRPARPIPAPAPPQPKSKPRSQGLITVFGQAHS